MGWSKIWHHHYKVPCARGNDQWVSFEDLHSISIKVMISDKVLLILKQDQHLNIIC